MSEITAKDALLIMSAMYKTHFGGGSMPYGGKDYPIIKTLSKQRGGFDELIADFEHMLESDAEWLRGRKSLSFFIKFYGSIGAMRDAMYRDETPVASMKDAITYQYTKEAEYREARRKELFDD